MKHQRLSTIEYQRQKIQYHYNRLLKLGETPAEIFNILPVDAEILINVILNNYDSITIKKVIEKLEHENH